MPVQHQACSFTTVVQLVLHRLLITGSQQQCFSEQVATDGAKIAQLVRNTSSDKLMCNDKGICNLMAWFRLHVRCRSPNVEINRPSETGVCFVMAYVGSSAEYP